MQDSKTVTVDVFLILALCACAARVSLVFQWGQFFQRDDYTLMIAMLLTFTTCLYAVNSQFNSFYWDTFAQNVSENGIFSVLHASSMLASRVTALLLGKRIFRQRKIGNLLKYGQTIAILLWLPVSVIGVLQAMFDRGGLGNTFMDLDYLLQIPVSIVGLLLTLTLVFLPLPWVLPLKVASDDDLVYAKFGMGFLMAVGCVVMAAIRLIFSFFAVGKLNRHWVPEFLVMWGCLESCLTLVTLCLPSRPLGPKAPPSKLYQRLENKCRQWSLIGTEYSHDPESAGFLSPPPPSSH